LGCKGDKSQACNVVGSDEVQEKNNDNSNVAAVGDEYQNKVDEYFANIQAKYPNDKIPYLTYGQKLAICLGQKHVPMLDKFDEHLETFHKENVLHANDRKLHEYMLDPASWKPDDVMIAIRDSKILQKVNMNVQILGYPSINSAIDWHYFTVKELIETMRSLVSNPKTQMINCQHFI